MKTLAALIWIVSAIIAVLVLATRADAMSERDSHGVVARELGSKDLSRSEITPAPHPSAKRKSRARGYFYETTARINGKTVRMTCYVPARGPHECALRYGPWQTKGVILMRPMGFDDPPTLDQCGGITYEWPCPPQALRLDELDPEPIGDEGGGNHLPCNWWQLGDYWTRWWDGLGWVTMQCQWSTYWGGYGWTIIAIHGP